AGRQGTAPAWARPLQPRTDARNSSGILRSPASSRRTGRPELPAGILLSRLRCILARAHYRSSIWHGAKGLFLGLARAHGGHDSAMAACAALAFAVVGTSCTGLVHDRQRACDAGSEARANDASRDSPAGGCDGFARFGPSSSRGYFAGAGNDQATTGLVGLALVDDLDAGRLASPLPLGRVICVLHGHFVRCLGVVPAALDLALLASGPRIP